MRRSRMMWLVVSLAACILVLQYHVSSTWLTATPSIVDSAAGLAEPGGEDLIRVVVDRLQLDSEMATSVGHKVLRDLVLQVGRQLISVGSCGEIAALAAPAPTSQPPPPLYIITPTYRRPEQIPELTRMAQTLMHIRNLHWLVIEDANNRSQLVTNLLLRTGLSYEHLVAPMPETYKTKRGPKPRGVSNRNRGLEWIKANATHGVFYFADDDNTYDIELFEEIRYTKRISMWPVGLCTKFGMSTPVVTNGSFSGFYDGWIAGRKWPVDMAGFAVSVQFLLQRPKAMMPYRPGYEEDGFLKSLAPFEPNEIELKANNCTKVLVWHTQTKKNEPSAALNITKYGHTNLALLKQLIV